MHPGFVPVPSDKPHRQADREPRTSPLGRRLISGVSCEQQQESRAWISSLGREMEFLNLSPAELRLIIW